jgi:hypothetical protein
MSVMKLQILQPVRQYIMKASPGGGEAIHHGGVSGSNSKLGPSSAEISSIIERDILLKYLILAHALQVSSFGAKTGKA